MMELLGHKKTPVRNRGYFVPGHQKPYSYLGLETVKIIINFESRRQNQ